MTLPRLDEGEGRRVVAEALPRRRSLLNRFDRVRRKLDTLLPTQQLQQNKHPLMRTQGTEQSDLIAQWTAANPHTRARHKSRLRQLNQTATSRDLISLMTASERAPAADHETPRARGPPRIPSAGNHQHEGITGEERRRDRDLAAMAAALLAQLRVINFIAVDREAMKRQRRAMRFELRTASPGIFGATGYWPISAIPAKPALASEAGAVRASRYLSPNSLNRSGANSM